MKKFDYTIILVIGIMLLSVLMGLFLVNISYMEVCISRTLAIASRVIGFASLTLLPFYYGRFIQEYIDDKKYEEE